MLRYGDKHNADVAGGLKAELSMEYGSDYSDAVIQSMILFLALIICYMIITLPIIVCICMLPGVVYRHYESRRRRYNDDQPSRLRAKQENDKRNKIRSRQRQACNTYNNLHLIQVVVHSDFFSFITSD